MRRYNWGFENPCWIGYADGQGWYMYIQLLKADGENLVCLLNEQGKKEIQDKTYMREAFKKTIGFKIPEEITVKMKEYFEIYNQELILEGIKSRIKLPYWGKEHYGDCGTRAFDSASGL